MRRQILTKSERKCKQMDLSVFQMILITVLREEEKRRKDQPRNL